MHTHTSVFTHKHTCAYIHTSVYTHTHTHTAHTCTQIYIYMPTNIHTCIWTCTHTTHTHTNTHTICLGFKSTTDDYYLLSMWFNLETSRRHTSEHACVAFPERTNCEKRPALNMVAGVLDWIKGAGEGEAKHQHPSPLSYRGCNMTSYLMLLCSCHTFSAMMDYTLHL